MKKFIYLLPLVLFLSSCNQEIDKKINLENYPEKILKIQASHPEYALTDFVKADEIFKNLEINTKSAGKTKTTLTYRQLLDQAKAENQRLENEIKAYQARLEAFENAVTISVMEMIYKECESKSDSVNLNSKINFTNNTDKAIARVEGHLTIKDASGKKLKECFVNRELGELGAKACIEHAVNFRAKEGDMIEELRTIPAHEYVYDWKPSAILYADGTRHESPKKPDHLQ